MLTEAKRGEALSQVVLPVAEDDCAKWLPVLPGVMEKNRRETKAAEDREKENLYY